MAYTAFKVREVVDRAVAHEWSVPEFQRGFVWKATQVRDLAESIWLNYPIGSVLIWDAATKKEAVEPKNASDAKAPSKWLVDGQQRTTALCILAGRKPYWWSSAEAWNDVLKRYDVRFDIDAKESPFFVVANAATRKTRTNRYLPLQTLLNIDLAREDGEKQLKQLAKDIKADGLCDGMDAMEVFTRLSRLCRMRDGELVGITVDHDLEDVVDIFGRLNSKGTRVRESDIYLGVVAARSPGWVRDEFMPFLDKLETQGFEVTPNLLFQALTAIGENRVRFKQVDDAFWNPDKIAPAWKKTQQAWGRALKFLEQYGILSNAILPSDAVFIPIAALFAKFDEVVAWDLFHWMMQALRYGRYSGSSTSSLDEDLREIEAASTASQAIEKMLGRIRAIEPIAKEEFLRDYSDTRFGRLLLYLLVFDREAEDWSTAGGRIAFQGDELVRGFAPQFHHVFPRDFLKDKAKPEQIEALANIAIISGEANIRISNKAPLAYFARYGISPERRRQQFIEGDVETMTPANFSSWLDARAALLAKEANAFLARP